MSATPGPTEPTELNRQLWDERAPAHAASSGYAFDSFVSDPAYLSHVVRFDRERLGDLAGVRGVHLQCHIGTDTVSLSRLGASMSGLDFSTESLTQARRLAERVGADIDYREAEVDDAVEVFGAGQFDLVYTGVGALCWLPDITRWAHTVAALLRPGGRLFVREGHPMLWALDDKTAPATLRYPYFETVAPLLYEEDGTYVPTDAVFAHTVSATWNHGLGETVTALMAAGLQLRQFVEHDSVPWEALPGQMTCDDAGEWRLTTEPERLAATYTIDAVKV